ncbi:hypothetical protein ACR6C2_07655 [Streptomyces sp. INA 01156]
MCRDCAGAVVSVLDTGLDGTAPYVVTGTLDQCSGKDCPTNYATECWSRVTAQVSYDNTRGSTCGSIEPNPSQCAGTWAITSWVIDGVEQVTTPVQFTANGCGGNSNQFHGAWAATLATIDPTSTWQPAYNGVCLHYIRTASVDPNRVYGQMQMHNTAAPATVYTLGPASSRDEAQFTKVYTQECDGSTSISWMDADGVEIPQPEGELTLCGGVAALAAPGRTSRAGPPSRSCACATSTRTRSRTTPAWSVPRRSCATWSTTVRARSSRPGTRPRTASPRTRPSASWSAGRARRACASRCGTRSASRRTPPTPLFSRTPWPTARTRARPARSR